MKNWLALLLFPVAAAWAQDNPPPPAAAPAVTRPPIATPSPPHVCQLFASADILTDETGSSVLAFHIAMTGETKDVAVVQSSGNPELDRKAIACASMWKYLPALQGGKPVEVPWKASVNWRLQNGSSQPPPQPPTGDGGLTHSCAGYYPPELLLAGISGVTTVLFTVSADGGVSNSAVYLSSGNATFDAAALACVRELKFSPAMQDGSPVTVQRSASIRWSADVLLRSCARYYAGPPIDFTTIRPQTDVKVTMANGGPAYAVSHPSGNDALDAAALRCVSGWNLGPNLNPTFEGTAHLDWQYILRPPQ